MEKTLAVITIVITDATIEETGASSGSGFRGGVDYLVALRPNADKAILSTSWDEKNAAETVLAHELGHTVATIFRDESHNPALKLLASIMGDSVLIPSEKLAWKLGETIYPELSKKQESEALRSYGDIGGTV